MCYKSADNKIASVTSKGVVKGKKKGTTVITVTSAVNPKISTSFRVTVKKPQIAVTSIETASEVTLEPGSGIHLRTTVTPMEATNKKLTFTSADPQVAKVLDAEEGKILGIQVGTTTVTIQSADKKVTKKVRIVVKKKIVKVKEIHIKDCESYFWNYNRPDGKEVRAYKVLKPGQSWKAECEIKPLNATSKKLYWTSSDPSMVTVSQDGTITAVGLGENAPYGYSMSKCEVYAYSCDGAAKSEYVDITVSLQMTPKQTYQYLREHPKMNSLTMYVPKSLAVRWYEYLQKECPEKTKSWWDGMSPQEYWDNDYKAGGNKEYQTTPIGGLKVKYKGEIYWRFDNIGLFDIQTEKSLKEYETEEYDPNLVEYFGW